MCDDNEPVIQCELGDCENTSAEYDMYPYRESDADGWITICAECKERLEEDPNRVLYPGEESELSDSDKLIREVLEDIEEGDDE